MEHRDRLWPGGYTFLYDDGLFRPSTDTFLLGSFPRLRRGMTVCELGAGTGLLSLLLLAREPELTVTGVELQPQACALFRRTAEENGLQGRMHYLEGDLRQGLLPPGRFRLAVANPPYFPPDAGAVAPDAARRTARHSLFYCKLKLVNLFHQGVQKLSFRHLADDLTFFENETLSLAAGDAEVSLARFAGAVDNTAHDGNGDVLINVFECLFDLIGKADEVDTCSAAGGAGNKLYAAAQTERA